MDPIELATARSRMYALLGRLLVDGPRPEVLPLLAQLPALADLAASDPESLGADHHDVLGHQVPPFEGVFRGEDGALGGPASTAVRGRYLTLGFQALPDHTEPDHVGVELGALAFLCGAEADALRDGQRAAAVHIAGLQQAFLTDHLMAWLPALVVAVRRQGVTWGTRLVELALELATSHAEAGPANTAPAAPTLLDDARTGLKQVSRWLLVPSHVGSWMSPRDIDRIAGAVDLPRGFGSREKMLESLFFAAIDHDRLSQLTDVLLGELGRWRGDLATLHADDWVARTEHGQSVVRRIGAAQA